ncbi:hypothetical protein Bca4012_026907 [Brassica carinata]
MFLPRHWSWFSCEAFAFETPGVSPETVDAGDHTAVAEDLVPPSPHPTVPPPPMVSTGSLSELMAKEVSSEFTFPFFEEATSEAFFSLQVFKGFPEDKLERRKQKHQLDQRMQLHYKVAIEQIEQVQINAT